MRQFPSLWSDDPRATFAECCEAVVDTTHRLGRSDPRGAQEKDIHIFRNIKGFALAAFAVIGLSAASAHAQYDESRIRQDSQQTQVEGYNGYATFFTITGLGTDYIVTPFYCGQLRNAPFVYQRVPTSGGQTSYRFCVTARRAWDQCIIELWRGSSFIDGDRVRVY